MLGLRRKKNPENNSAEMTRRYYKGIALSLLTSVRRRLPEDSPLISSINDYSLFMRLDEENYISSTISFDLPKVADKALASVRQLHSLGTNVHTMLSIKSDTPRYWKGAAELVEALLRNLLMISLIRVNYGVVYLRIEHQLDAFGSSSLILTLEDTSDPLPPGCIQHWIDQAAKKSMISGVAMDIYWPLIVRIIARLNGEIKSGDSENGMKIVARVSMTFDDLVHNRNPAMTEKDKYCSNGTPPLVLMVEDDQVNRSLQQKMFEDAGYHVFSVADGNDALEWAALLPFSLITLDAMLPGISGPAIAVRLKRMMDEGAMRRVPIIALTAADSSHDREIWQEAGIEQLLFKPLSAKDIAGIKSDAAEYESFFMERDKAADAELIETSAARLPEMDKHLKQQVVDFCELAKTKCSGLILADAAHGIKSASLSLGFYRLGGLAAAIEHNLRTDRKNRLEPNMQVITQGLLRECANI